MLYALNSVDQENLGQQHLVIDPKGYKANMDLSAKG
jgi:hypothetical protein